jgi:hypothetical protein
MAGGQKGGLGKHGKIGLKQQKFWQTREKIARFANSIFSIVLKPIAAADKSMIESMRSCQHESQISSEASREDQSAESEMRPDDYAPCLIVTDFEAVRSIARVVAEPGEPPGIVSVHV